MARTRIIRRNTPQTKPPPMLTALDTPKSPPADSTAITKMTSEPGSAQASSLLTEPCNDSDKLDAESDDKDVSVTNLNTKKPAA